MASKRIAVDTSKSVFTLRGVDECGRPILRQDLTRARFEMLLAKTSPTEVVLERAAAPIIGDGLRDSLVTRCG